MFRVLAQLCAVGLVTTCAEHVDLQLMQMHTASLLRGSEIWPGCRTSTQGDECYEKVMWAMRTGINQHPKWYLPLTSNSSFEDFQQHLHAVDRLSDVCPKPCAAAQSEERPTEQLPAVPQECRTSVEGDECYEKVMWAMRTGIKQHPKWYIPLTSNSSFEDFQQHLHTVDRLSDVCPKPCAAVQSEERPTEQLPAVPHACRTSVEGDECYEKVMWAMRTGIKQHPKWYIL
ncbi:unnamed protein product [Prorocentrum cordatum]|uniref:Uncharacterized protein n=1 Tax=Prorocentrum cordatum TaxID=2364126 RepID=A0ABN9TTF1_9DINO|nr:unnamed protein product [Polarella glacialis]